MKTKDHLILIHGLGRSSKSMHKPEEYFSQKGYDVLNLDYPSRKEPLQALSEKYLKPAIKANCIDPQRKIHFITHSFGGILLRYFLAQNSLPNLGRVIQLAPPNRGSTWADRLSQIPKMKRVFGPALKTLQSSNESLVNQIPPPYYELGIVSAQYDAKVSLEQTKLPHMTDHLVVPSIHTTIMNKKIVLEALEHFLKKGKFPRN